MTRVPILTEVVLRAWGTDDPRAVSALRAENQPARTYRARMVERRALDAGWPVLWEQDSRQAATAALRRLEGGDWTPQGIQARHRRRVAAAQEQPRAKSVAYIHDWADDDTPATIFDE